MTAEGEEIGIDVVHLTAEQGRKCLRDGHFSVCVWRPPGRLAGQFRQRKRLAVKLSVGRERQRADLQQHHRHHMGRQLSFKRVQQRIAVQRQAGPGDDIPYQLSGIAPGCRRLIKHARVRYGLRHVRQRKHRTIDFAELDTLTTNFQLIVTAAQIFHRAVIQPARHVAGAVHPLARCKGIGNEAAGGQVRTTEIPLRKLDPGKIEVTGHAERHRTHHRIQNAQPRIPYREANRHAVARHRSQFRTRRRIPAHVHRRFCWTIEVMQRDMSKVLPLLTQFCRQRFPTAEHLLQGLTAVGIFRRQRGNECRQHRRHKVCRGHAIMREEVLHRLRIAVRVRLGHHQLRAGDKGPPELPDRDVKTARRLLRHHVMRVQRIVVLHPHQAVNDGGMPYHHAFWPSR